MSDVTLGTLPAAGSMRDAIHVAVVPMVAAEKLWPGERIGCVHGFNSLARKCDKVIGIVDPFLTEAVQPEQLFWMAILPGTVTGMRHEWQHPMFEAVDDTPKDEKAVSEAWLREAAMSLGIRYDSLLYEDFDLFTGEYIDNGEPIRDRWYDIAEEFWKHYKVVTGRDVPEEKRGGFTCSC